jgi:hypothetical protein
LTEFVIEIPGDDGLWRISLRDMPEDIADRIAGLILSAPPAQVPEPLNLRQVLVWPRSGDAIGGEQQMMANYRRCLGLLAER